MALPAGRIDRPDRPVFTVGELTERVKNLLEGELATVWVEGEISNFTHHSSGHMYFSLKDEQAQVRCVFFRGLNQRLKFRPEAGMKVRAYGAVTVYKPRGEYQLSLRSLVPVGRGELELAFRQLKEKLEKEGLFLPERKKSLPFLPGRVGVITSPTGAAIHDMIRSFGNRFPVELLLYPVRVQGEGAAAEIASAIDRLNELGHVEVIIVGRGGGSLEDLWAFNEELVARAIARSELPVVSAVGHEVDVTMSDLVADFRAATPTAAAEALLPSREELEEDLTRHGAAMSRRVLDTIRYMKERLRGFARSRALARPVDLLREQQQRLDELSRQMAGGLRRKVERETDLLGSLYGRMERAVDTGIRGSGTALDELVHRLDLAVRRVDERFAERLRSVSEKLATLDPHAVLGRGYSITRSEVGRAVTDAALLSRGETVTIRFRSGEADAEIKEIRTEKMDEESNA